MSLIWLKMNKEEMQESTYVPESKMILIECTNTVEALYTYYAEPL